MKMTFRWYGEGRDPISLKKIKQIPGMSGLMGVLDEKAAGEVWTYEECKAYVDHIHEAGLECEVIESVNVHEDIKMGLPTRDQYIANYCETIRNLAKVGVKVIIYNFMPVFDWLRTDLAREIPEDGSNSLYFDEKELGEMTPVDLVKKTLDDCHGISLPGWEPERLADLERVLAIYKDIDQAKLRENFKYFLDGIIPTCEEVGVKMACHPDDPAWPVFGLPRITARPTMTSWLSSMILRPTRCACAPVLWAPIRTTTFLPSSVTSVRWTASALCMCATSSTWATASSGNLPTCPAAETWICTPS